MTSVSEQSREVQMDAHEVPSDVRHATWCDPAEHAKVAAEMPGEPVRCVGRPIYVKVGGRDLGGWWAQHDLDSEPTFDLEWDLKFTDVPIGTLLSLYKLFLGMSWRDVSSIGTALGEAIDAYEGGDAWRDSLNL